MIRPQRASHLLPAQLAICRCRAYPEVLDAVRLVCPEMGGAAFHLRVGKDCYSECFAMAGLLPRVGLILTGGAIDLVGTDRLDLAWDIEANKGLCGGGVLSQLPELKRVAPGQELPFRRLPSQALVDSDWLDLARKIHSIFEQDEADGIVITHGTNTLEKTAYFLNLVLKTDKPVVLV